MMWDRNVVNLKITQVGAEGPGSLYRQFAANNSKKLNTIQNILLNQDEQKGNWKSAVAKHYEINYTSLFIHF